MGPVDPEIIGRQAIKKIERKKLTQAKYETWSVSLPRGLNQPFAGPSLSCLFPQFNENSPR